MKEKIRTICFTLILFSISLGNLFTPIKHFSYKENRYLQDLPKFSYKSLISNKFAKDFETYTTDQFMARDFWIGMKTMSDLSILKKDNGRVYFGKDFYLIDKDEPIDEKQLEKNMAYISSFINNINREKNIAINILLIPSKSQVMGGKLPSYAPVVNEVELVEELKVKLNLKLKPNLKVLDLISTLTNKNHEYIYYRTDHHWTSLGAFYGYEAYLKEKGLKPLSKEDFTIRQVTDKFLGTSYRKANLYFGQADKIHNYRPKIKLDYSLLINGQVEANDIYDESYLDKTDKYSYFFGGDKALIEITTSVKNGKTIAIFKDSLANSFLPFLMNHYENILVIDTRYLNISMTNLINERDIDEILFLYNIQNLAQEKSFIWFNK